MTLEPLRSMPTMLAPVRVRSCNSRINFPVAEDSDGSGTVSSSASLSIDGSGAAAAE